MFTSFSTALSALSATSTAIDVVGNNLANLNTPGFKTSQVCFRDLVTQSLGAGLGETQVGFGTGQPLTVREFTQGRRSDQLRAAGRLHSGRRLLRPSRPVWQHGVHPSRQLSDGQDRQPPHVD